MGKYRIQKIVSGGQTGADRAGLDWAIENDVPYDGWCPLGRRAEDGAIPERYNLNETPSYVYLERTEWNARDSDGTVIFTETSELSGGSLRTAEFADLHSKPWLHLDQSLSPEDATTLLTAWLENHEINCLNVAGSRASGAPTVGDFVRSVLDGGIEAAVSGGYD